MKHMPVNEGRSSELLSRLARLIAADGYDQHLQPVQWQALRFLALANRFSRTPRGLTAWLGQTKGSVSQTINTLVRKGLVERRTDMQDRRIVHLALTPAGQQLVESTQPVSAEWLAALSPKEQATFASLTEKMLHAAIKARGGRAFGICADCRHFEKAPGNMHRCALLDEPLSNADSTLFCFEQVAA